jgi:hypothetical protein
MAYPYDVKTILKLMQALSETTKFRLTNASLKEMHIHLSNVYKNVPFGEDYLYKQVFQVARKRAEAGQQTISLNEFNIEYLLGILEYDNLEDFEQRYGKPSHHSLSDCTGTWYSYVRCNSGNPDVLRSPVSISETGKDIQITLKGPLRKFNGKLTWEAGCIYSLLESNSGKKLQLIFRASGINKPNVLQGVFAGVSAGGEPIAGRELLVRQDVSFDELTNEKVSIDYLMSSSDQLLQRIGNYFSDKHTTILKAGSSFNFEITDLALAPNPRQSAVKPLEKTKPAKKPVVKKRR